MTDRGIYTCKQHEEFYLRDGNICFLVENTLFRLHKYFFDRESDYFRERFKTSDQDDNGSVERPYVIPDVKCDEFAHFVWVWYNPRYSFSKQDKTKWLTILRLATEWRFPEIRQLAIRHLEKVELDPIEKITTYKQHAVDRELLLPSYVKLCRSPVLPSPKEGAVLTMETVLKLARAREQVVLRACELGCKTPSTAGAPDDLVEAIVAESFELSPPVRHSDLPRAGPIPAEVVTVKEPKKGNLNGSEAPTKNGPPFVQSKTTTSHEHGQNGITRGEKKQVGQRGQ